MLYSLLFLCSERLSLSSLFSCSSLVSATQSSPWQSSPRRQEARHAFHASDICFPSNKWYWNTKPVSLLFLHSYHCAGVTVLGTVTVMLGALLASSVLELRSQPGSSDGLESHHHRLAEAQAIASGVLAGANMLLLFILRKLALTISAVERAKLNEKFLVKQSESLRAEYNRLHEDKDPKQGAGLGEAAKLRAALDELQEVNSDLQVRSQGCVSKARQWS